MNMVAFLMWNAVSRKQQERMTQQVTWMLDMSRNEVTSTGSTNFVTSPNVFLFLFRIVLRIFFAAFLLFKHGLCIKWLHIAPRCFASCFCYHVASPIWSSVKSQFVPMKSTNTYDYSNNFLPNHEYQLFRMVKTVDIIDPQGLLPQTPESPNVLIFQGT